MRKVLIFCLMLICLQAFAQETSSFDNLAPITSETIGSLRVINTILSDGNRNGESLVKANGNLISTAHTLLDLETGTRRSFPENTSVVALHPLQLIALISGSETLLYNLTTDSSVYLRDGSTDEATFSPDGKQVLTTSLALDKVEMWDATSGNLIAHLGRPDPITSAIVFAPNSRYAYWRGVGGQMMIWDRESVAELFNIMDILSGSSLPVASHQDNYLMVPTNAPELFIRLNTKNRSSRMFGTGPQPIDKMAISDDGNWLAVSNGANLTLWDHSHERPRKVFTTQSDYQSHLLFTPDSQTLIHLANQELILYDVTTGTKIASKSFEIYSFNTVEMNHAGTLLAIGDYRSIQVYSLDRTLDIVASFEASSGFFSHDDRFFIASGAYPAKTYYVYSTAPNALYSFPIPGETVPDYVTVRALPDRNAPEIGRVGGVVTVEGRTADNAYVYVPDVGGWIRSDPTYFAFQGGLSLDTLAIIDTLQVASLPTSLPPLLPTLQPTNTGKPPATSTPPPPQSLDTLRLPSENSNAVPASQDFQTITANNADNVALLKVVPIPYQENVNFSQLIAANGERMLSAVELQTSSSDYQYSSLDLNTFSSQSAFTLRRFLDETLISPDGTLAATFMRSGLTLTLYLNELPSAKVLSSWTIPTSNGGFKLIFSPDSKTLASPAGLLDVSTGKVRSLIPDSGLAAFSADSQRIAVQTNQRLFVYDVYSGQLISKSDFYNEDFYSYETPIFSPDGKVILMIADGQLQVIDAETGATRFPIYQREPSFSTSYYGIRRQSQFSPNSQFLLVMNIYTDSTSQIDVYNAVTGQFVGRYATNSTGFAISPDGKLLALGNPLRLLDLVTGNILTVEGNYASYQMTFSADGTLLFASTSSAFAPSVMIFGIPTENRTAWQSISAEVIPTGINVREVPSVEASVVGIASGTVEIMARNNGSRAVYIENPPGWIWADDDYLNLLEVDYRLLPIRFVGE